MFGNKVQCLSIGECRLNELGYNDTEDHAALKLRRLSVTDVSSMCEKIINKATYWSVAIMYFLCNKKGRYIRNSGRICKKLWVGGTRQRTRQGWKTFRVCASICFLDINHANTLPFQNTVQQVNITVTKNSVTTCQIQWTFVFLGQVLA